MNVFDVAVVGGGHAGIEAAVAAARLGQRTLLITMDAGKIGMMSCNPAIGGLAKGQLVKEIDALGGVMGRITDLSGIHFKMLNTSKGPAVQSPRAQADRNLYVDVARRIVESVPGLTVMEAIGTGIRAKNNRITAVVLKDGSEIPVKALIVTAGTFLNGIIHIGLHKMAAGRAGELPAEGMTESLNAYGFRSSRLKTGTPARIHRDTIDYDSVTVQKPDAVPRPFSYHTESIDQEQVDCYITHTNALTHDILREGFDRSPLFSGRIKGIGPRYCPSVEDKVNRFAEKDRHQLFLEPEGYNNIEVYVNGFSSSLPGDIQERALHTVKGLERAKIIRLGYAVEYDFFPPDQLRPTLETKGIDYLYFAGQINGTSGYEEAAAQGLIAGINAAQKLSGNEPFVLSRSDAYIGVLTDDLINKIHNEPYRMFTSRAEFRLLLRQDNADMRLMEKGRQLGMIEDTIYQKFQNKMEKIEALRDRITSMKIDAGLFNKNYEGRSAPIKQSMLVRDIIKRPEITLRNMLQLLGEAAHVHQDAINEVEFNIKYDGYVRRQLELLDKFKRMEDKGIPERLNYEEIKALSREAREKLNRIKPRNLGQASRISGVSHADLSVLLIYLEKYRIADVPRETT